ncbi:MAG: flagellar assembly peptidoglycan hydrolase FlgJ [Methylococcales bacterium]|nr:flagellar assembly peptidoglycan hydrolase FlgJ [Methylococcales bacterium]
MLNVQNADVYTDFNGLAKLKNEAREQSPEALKQAAKQFESLFLNMVLKSMRQAKLGDGLLDNDQSKFYQDMYDQQLAVHLSGEPGIGLADLMVKQLGGDQTRPLDNKDITDYINNPLVNAGTSQASSGVYSDLDRIKLETIRLGDAQAFALGALDPPDALEVQVGAADAPATTVSESKQTFVEHLLPLAQKAAAELGVEPKVLIAQAALETGWGHSVIKNRDGSSSYNLFNIKVSREWDGKQARVSALEFEGGVAKKVQSGFRAYASYADSFNDYVKFIKENPRYADALRQVSNPEQYMRELQQAGYATDPRYAGKVMTIYNSKAFTASESAQTLAMR